MAEPTKSIKKKVNVVVQNSVQYIQQHPKSSIGVISGVSGISMLLTGFTIAYKIYTPQIEDYEKKVKNKESEIVDLALVVKQLKEDTIHLNNIIRQSSDNTNVASKKNTIDEEKKSMAIYLFSSRKNSELCELVLEKLQDFGFEKVEIITGEYFVSNYKQFEPYIYCKDRTIKNSETIKLLRQIKKDFKQLRKMEVMLANDSEGPLVKRVFDENEDLHILMVI